MSNLKTNTEQLEVLLAKVKALPEGGSVTGEDVTEEVNTYTEKIAQLETVVTALETELASKASGGSSETVEMCNGVIKREKNLAFTDSDSIIYTIDENHVLQTYVITEGTKSFEFQAIKNSIIVCDCSAVLSLTNAEFISSALTLRAFFITDDNFIIEVL